MCLCTHMCLCYVNMCVNTGGGSRKVLGHLDLELQAPDTGSRNWTVVVCRSSKLRNH